MSDPATPPVDLQTLQRYLRDTEVQIQNLEGEKADLLKRIEAIMLYNDGDTKTVEERFELWLKYGMKKDYGWIQHIESKSGLNLLEYDVFIYWSKHQTIPINRVSDKLYEILEEIENPTDSVYGISAKVKTHEVTMDTVHEWMEELMRLNFGSCIMDW